MVAQTETAPQAGTLGGTVCGEACSPPKGDNESWWSEALSLGGCLLGSVLSVKVTGASS